MAEGKESRVARRAGMLLASPSPILESRGRAEVGVAFGKPSYAGWPAERLVKVQRHDNEPSYPLVVSADFSSSDQQPAIAAIDL